ncbi:glycoside hydrolase family 44 protein [Telmatocola sphagniphila]|uniref:Glycoside hydrolase family 44 protein n=1 Tax=Telmatocola sphagniphila TaxID=1123043 RepID=A0A8E6B3Z9_9BACT|nr:glycoside hydrolase family 44 protein [Telmatocola sphagniphila]QVL30917.1 glycoside hydrolase family 44 protein [Telmatocola sphagniphila]
MQIIKNLLALAGVSLLLIFGSSYYHARTQAESNDDKLVVWSSSKPQGKTWHELGTKGGVVIVPRSDSPTECGLLVRMTSPQFRSFGLNWKNWYPTDACDDCSRFQSLSFKVRLLINQNPTADLGVRLVDNNQGKDTKSGAVIPIVSGGYIKELTSEWQQVRIPLERFATNRTLKLNRLWEIVFSNDDKAEQLFQIDEIAFTKEPQESKPAKAQPNNTGTRPEVASNISRTNPSESMAAMPVNTYPARAKWGSDRTGWPIRDTIYGVADMPKEKRQAYGLPLSRFGGNTTSRYNWRINADSGADDWFYKNRGNPAAPEDNAYWKHLEENYSLGASSYVCVPMLGWVAKDNSSYGFPVSKYGEQKSHEPNSPDVGNGLRKDGSPITGNDPKETSVAFSPEDVASGVKICVDRANQLSQQGLKQPVRYWVLDNEPMLWHKTHRDVHPNPASYDELWTKTVQYAEAIRQVDPQARIAGFCSWGWVDLFYSAQDQGYDSYHSKPDHRAHGELPLAEWFLKKCAEYKRAHGRNLIDVLDVHWYPQAEINGKSPFTGKGSELNELRLRTTRDLWDSSYTQESWVRNSGDRRPVALIPRMKQLIEKYCPGMDLCLGEYNFGGAENITGGLAQTEIFGIFAQQKLDLAFFWQQPEGTQWAAWELFRNYDGQGGKFGDRYLPMECDHPKCAVFAARRQSDNAVTVILLNKSLAGSCRLKLELPGLEGQGKLWRFDSASYGKVYEVPGITRVNNGQTEVVLPPGSASMFVVR